ncbi:MAG: glycosyltransferase [Candidatus Limnocylindria bacterium]
MITRLNVGGPAIHAALLTARLDLARFETLLVTGREGPAEGSMRDLGRLPDGLSPVVVGSLGRAVSPLDDLRALREVTSIARRFRPHVVHTHLAKAGFVGRIAAQMAGARAVVHTYHGTVFRGYFGRAESGLYLNVERLLGRLTTRIVAITPRQRRELLELGIAPERKIVEIPLGLDLEPFRSLPDPRQARASFGLDPALPCVALVARLVPIKDVGTFLRAFAALGEDGGPTAQALVVGDGEERASLEAMARDLGIAGRCRFTGWQSDMPRVYGAADVVALSSLSEGSPVSLIEAMAAGRPVVGTAVGGVPDIVSPEAGILVAPADSEALRGAIAALLSDPERRQALGSAGSRVAHKRFGVARLVRDVEALYTELLASNG